MSTGLPTRLLAALLLLAAPVTRAQNRPAAAPAGPALKTYQGEYEGRQATYTYYLAEDGRRVRHGSFVSVRREQVNSLILGYQVINRDFVEHRETGAYTNGARTGRWTTTETEYSVPGNRKALLPLDLTRRQTTVLTYVAGAINGPATYADVPWKAGKPGAPTVSASGRRVTRPERTTLSIAPRSMFDQSVDEENPLTEKEKMGVSTEVDTTVEVTEYAAGPYRYTGDPDASDPARRPQTARGRFDAAGFCDSTWTLNYFKGGSERADATPRQQAAGWVTVVLDFDHGALLRERTTQESTGEIIGDFALPPSAARDTAARLVLLREPVHFHIWANAQNHPDEPEWQSPLADADDVTFFLHEATRPLGVPRLATIHLRLQPTAADSALLRGALAVHRAVRSQWPDSTLTDDDVAHLPAAFTDKSSIALLGTEQWRLLATDNADAQPGNATTYLKRSYEHDWSSADKEDPHPWLRALTETRPNLPAAEALELQRRYLLHMAKIRLRTHQLQARLVLAASNAAKL